MNYDEYKPQLNETLKSVNQSLETLKRNGNLPAIEEETRKLAERQEWIYKIVSTVAVVGVLFTVYRVR